MLAATYTSYGSPDVLRIQKVALPPVSEYSVLVKVYAASVNPIDWHFLRGSPFFVRAVSGLLKPKFSVLGADIAGIIEVVGDKVSDFKPGDKVFGGSGMGGFAEYVCVAANKLVHIPDGISFEQAAAVPVAALTALQGFRLANLQTGQKLLIEGASGGVGSFAVQIAKALGVHVTAVCSVQNLSIAEANGADVVIDYRQEDFTQSDQRYDMIFAANGYHSLADYKRVLTPCGAFIMAGGSTSLSLQTALQGFRPGFRRDKKISMFIANINKKDLLFVQNLLQNKQVVPVIDRRYAFNEIADALRYLEAGHAQGKVVISFGHASGADAGSAENNRSTLDA